jgi:hypothetical protein
MRRTTLTGFAVLAALAVAGLARAATVTVTTTVTGGGTLSVAGTNSPSFALTLTGDDQTPTYHAQLQVVDARGLAGGGGWNLSIGATQFGDGAGHTIPANAQSVTGVGQLCHTGSTCTTATNGVSNGNLAVPTSPSTAKFLNAANASGLGRIDLDVSILVAVPANTMAATYTSTLTVAIAAGP